MRRYLATLALAALLAFTADPSRAEVTVIGPGGFAVAHAIETAAAPEDAYRATVEDIAKWWDGDHSWSGAAENLYLDARPGGCFCERLPDGGGVEHLRIVYLAPGREIRLQGGLGPLQSMGLQGSMSWKILPQETGSKLAWQYTVHGYLDNGFEAIAAAVDGVIGAQLKRLEAYLAKN
jgi:hypothetical protein